MATPLKVLTALSASYGAAVSGSAGLKVQQGGLTVSDGTTAVQVLTATTISGSSTLQVGGDATLGGNLTVAGDLTINGTTTTVNTENVLVEDKNIILGNTAGANDTTANGGGISLSGSTVKTFNWVNGSQSWTSSENMDLASAKEYKLAGESALKPATETVLGVPLKTIQVVSGSTNKAKVVVGADAITGLVGVAAVSSSNFTTLLAPTVIISGSTGTQISNALLVKGITTLQSALTASAVSGTKGDFTELYVNGVAVGVGSGDITSVNAGTNLTGGAATGDATLSLANNITLSSVTASVGVSASLFILADGTILTSSQQFGGSGDVSKSTINAEYNSLRLVLSGTLDANGHADISLTDAKAAFATTALHSCSLDVMTDSDGTGWTNDLISVRLEVSASKLYAKIDAPAAPSAGYRVIAVNEADFLLT